MRFLHEGFSISLFCAPMESSGRNLYSHQGTHSRVCVSDIEDMSSDSDCLYHCTYPGCSYETNRSAHLKRHERIHTNERPYKCPYCDYCASRSDHLRRHYKIHGKTLGAVSSRFSRSHSVQVKSAPVARAVSVLQSMREVGVGVSWLCVAAIFIQFIRKCSMDVRKTSF